MKINFVTRKSQIDKNGLSHVFMSICIGGHASLSIVVEFGGKFRKTQSHFQIHRVTGSHKDI